MQMPTTHLSKLLTGLTLVSLVLLAPAALANPSPDEEILVSDKREAAPAGGEELSEAREEVDPNKATTFQSFNMVFCSARCDSFWDWCVDAGPSRLCILIDYAWCLTQSCPQQAPGNTIEQTWCCGDDFAASTY